MKHLKVLTKKSVSKDADKTRGQVYAYECPDTCYTKDWADCPSNANSDTCDIDYDACGGWGSIDSCPTIDYWSQDCQAEMSYDTCGGLNEDHRDGGVCEVDF